MFLLLKRQADAKTLHGIEKKIRKYSGNLREHRNFEI